MAGWHHRCNEHELGKTPRDGEGQGGLPCCSPWGRKELSTGNYIQDLLITFNGKEFEKEYIHTHTHIIYNVYTQYSWGSLAAQLVKNLPAMRKTWV